MATKRLRFLKSAIVAAACLVVLTPYGRAASDSFKPLTHVGETIPSFTVKELSGSTFSMAHERGKVVVVNFWATWCPPCRLEMPRLEKEIWNKYQSNPGFAMVAIARQQTEATIAGFHRAHAEFTYPLAYDPARNVYAKFADAGIPRSYVVDKHGRIVFQSVGYQAGDIQKLNRAIEKALAAR
jgi:peroxiredoxin